MDSQTVLFKHSVMHSLYMNRLEDLGIKKLVKTRLKEQLLERFPEVQEQYDGRNTIIIFKEGMVNMLKEALKKQHFSEDAVILAKAVMIIRKDIFSHQRGHIQWLLPTRMLRKLTALKIQVLHLSDFQWPQRERSRHTNPRLPLPLANAFSTTPSKKEKNIQFFWKN